MRTLIYGKYLVRGAGEGREIIKDGAVCVEGSEIRDVGSFKVMSKSYRYDRKIGSDRHMVMPGLTNSHGHGSGISLILRGILDGPLETWLQEFFHRGMEGWNTYDNAMLSCIDQIENGVTSFVNHYYSPFPLDSDRYAKDIESALLACLDSGGRVTFAPAFTNQNFCTYDDQSFLARLSDETKRLFNLRIPTDSEKSESSKLYFKRFRETHHKFDGKDERARVYLGPANVQWVSDDTWLEIKKTAQVLKTGIHTHLVETPYQAQYGSKFLGGKTPVEHLADLGVLGPEVSCGHSVWLSRDDMRIMARTGAVAVHNPSSNLRLFNGIAPVLEMKKAGMNVALGLDGTTINDEQDMFQEMRLCSLLHRLPGVEGRHLSSQEILDLNLTGGPKVALSEGKIGAVEIGWKADIILVNTTRFTTPFVSEKLSPFDLLVLRAKGSDVDHVMINGELVVRNKRFLRADKSKLHRRVSKWKERDSGLDQNLADLEAEIRSFYRGWDEEKGPTYRMNLM